MRRLSLFLFVALLFAACGNDKAQIESLEQEVLELHDEVMAKMPDLAKYEEALAKSVADTTAALDEAARIEMTFKIKSI